MLKILGWEIEDMGPVAGLLDSSVPGDCHIAAVNDTGVVVGDAPVMGSARHGFTIDGTTVTDFTPSDVQSMVVNDINAAGSIAGSLRTSAGDNCGFVRRPGGTVDLLKGPGSGVTAASGISPNGAIAGHRRTSGAIQAVVWEETGSTFTARSLHQSGFAYSAGHAINDDLNVSGMIAESSGTGLQCAVHDGHKWKVLFPADPSHRSYINAEGTVVGIDSSNASRLYRYGSLGWVDTAASQILFSTAYGLSDFTEIVGDGSVVIGTYTNPTAVFRDRYDQEWQLHLLLTPNTGWALHHARAISPKGGFIVGFGSLKSKDRVFRMRRVSHVDPGPQLPEIPHEWPYVIIGARLGERGIKIGPQGPEPVGPGSPGMSEAIRALALHELIGQLENPELRRRIQPMLILEAIEHLKAIEKGAGVEGKLRDMVVKRSPSRIEKHRKK